MCGFWASGGCSLGEPDRDLLAIRVSREGVTEGLLASTKTENFVKDRRSIIVLKIPNLVSLPVIALGPLGLPLHA